MSVETESIVHRILLVDDEPNILKSLRRLLMGEDDFDVTLANSGAEGLTHLAEDEYSVVVSDQRMPEMTGVEFLAQVRKKYPDTVRILLTGYADIEASIDAINKGAIFRYLTKPWDETQLLTTLKEACSHYWLKKENQRLNAIVVKQNVELEKWNSRLKHRVLEQTGNIKKKNDELFEVNQQLHDTFQETIKAFSNLSELQDPKAVDHSGKVAAISLAMAKDLKLTDEMCKQVEIAGLLHDIGKIGISHEILEKPYDYMDAKEQRAYEMHPVRGQAAIDQVEHLRSVGLLIRHHHERYDGTGFPDLLEGDKVPLGSRILSLADGFHRTIPDDNPDAQVELTLMKIREKMGTLYDPDLYAALETAVVEVYSAEVSPTEMVKMALDPRELRVGMILEMDVISGSGLLLLKRGSRMNETGIGAIQRHHAIDPFSEKIRVLVEK